MYCVREERWDKEGWMERAKQEEKDSSGGVIEAEEKRKRMEE